MESVKIDKDILLSKIIENRKIHIAEYNEAIEGYKSRVIEILKTNLKHAQTRELSRISQLVSLPVRPESHESDYDRVIAMLSMSVDVNITLTRAEFDQYVLDEWHWKRSFITSSMLYKNA